MSATAALSAAAVGSVVAGHQGSYAALTATLAVTTGILALVSGLARLGFVANFISEPVLKGFIIGLAMTIMVGQVPKLLGVSKGSGDFFDQLWHIIGELGDTSGWTALVGGISLALLLGLRQLRPESRRRSSWSWSASWWRRPPIFRPTESSSSVTSRAGSPTTGSRACPQRATCTWPGRRWVSSWWPSPRD